MSTGFPAIHGAESSRGEVVFPDRVGQEDFKSGMHPETIRKGRGLNCRTRIRLGSAFRTGAQATRCNSEGDGRKGRGGGRPAGRSLGRTAVPKAWVLAALRHDSPSGSRSKRIHPLPCNEGMPAKPRSGKLGLGYVGRLRFRPAARSSVADRSHDRDRRTHPHRIAGAGAEDLAGTGLGPAATNPVAIGPSVSDGRDAANRYAGPGPRRSRATLRLAAGPPGAQIDLIPSSPGRS